MSDNTSPPTERMIELIQIARGGVVFDAGLAQRLGEVLLEAHYGGAELGRQRPLIVTDKGDSWQIDGSWNRDRKIEGKGAFFLTVWKFDGRVTDMGIWGVVHPPRGPLEASLEPDRPRQAERNSRD